MLTGDKGLTAKIVGSTCGIIDEGMGSHLIQIEEDLAYPDYKQELNDCLTKA